MRKIPKWAEHPSLLGCRGSLDTSANFRFTFNMGMPRVRQIYLGATEPTVSGILKINFAFISSEKKGMFSMREGQPELYAKPIFAKMVSFYTKGLSR